jgi:hypothetical protein
MTDTTKLDALIVRNIADIEAAFNRVNNDMETVLARETANIFHEKIGSLGWEGDSVDEFVDGNLWLAPIEWRLADTASDEFDLYINFGFHAGINDFEGTWLAHFAGINGAGLQLELTSDTMKRKDWQTLLKREVGQKAIAALKAKGFATELKNAVPLTLKVKFDQEELAKAFEEEDFTEALEPLSKAIDTIAGLRVVLDDLVTAIRALE